MFQRLKIPDGWRGSVWQYSSHARLIESHRHDELEFNYVTQGEIDYLVGEQLVRLTVGSLLWLLPGHEHVLTRRSQDTTMWIAVFRQNLLPQRGGRPELRQLWTQTEGFRLVQIAGREYERLDQQCALIQSFQGSATGRNGGLAFLLEHAWAMTASREAQPPGAVIHPAVTRAVAWLRESPTRPDLASTARQVGLSATHFSRRFHEALGVTFRDFQQRLLVERAMALLVNHPEWSMTEAAFEAGFGSYPQFHRTFRRITGLGPRAWRRRALMSEHPPSDRLAATGRTLAKTHG